MKTLPLLVGLLLGLIACSSAQGQSTSGSSVGAWRLEGSPERVMIITEDYWAQAIFDRGQREFVRTYGGTYSSNGDSVEGRIDFDSGDPERVGQHFSVRGAVVDGELRLQQEDGSDEVWTRIDDGTGPLAGVWRISGRYRDGEMREMPLRARRTLKVLSGSRFQWIAMNIETGEFSGTGGGTYTFENGTYTERIEFFSRDSSRVGASLEFEGTVDGDTWRHRGLSSRGEPIDEVWTRLEVETP